DRRDGSMQRVSDHESRIIHRSRTMDTDNQMQADVMNELKWEPSVDAAHIGVAAKDGAVTLTGHVPSYFAKAQAVKAAERGYAVRVVADEMVVQLPSNHVHDDTSIAEAISHTLNWSVSVPHDVDVEVADGW